MPDIDQFEYLSNAAFTKNRLLFEDADLLRFYADDANEVDGERPIAMSLPELVSLVGGKLQFVHTQSTPSTTWAVEHNLGAQVDTVSIYVNGQLVYANVQLNPDNLNLTITFAVPTVGIAIIEL